MQASYSSKTSYKTTDQNLSTQALSSKCSEQATAALYAAAYRFHRWPLWNNGSPAGACHRARRRRDPVAGMTRECMRERGPMTVVILRESGVSSTPRLIDFIAGVSGILGLLGISDDCGIARRYLREHPSLTPKLVALKALALTFLIAQVVTCRRRALP